MLSLYNLDIVCLFLVLAVTLVFVTIISKDINHVFSAFAQIGNTSSLRPIINDPHLKTDLVFTGIKNPTNMAFLGPDDILVLEKDTGMVKRIKHGIMQPQPLLDVNVATTDFRGLLGIVVSPTLLPNGHKYIFIYYTQSGGGKDADDVDSNISAVGNRLYRYELDNDKLVNPKLLLDLPANPPSGAASNGGEVIVGPDNNVYVPIGDIKKADSPLQNVLKGQQFNGTNGILRVTEDGKPVLPGILDSNKSPLNLYYAYGIYNSFGLDFDPITHKLWDTENGPAYGDEINLVEPGFNSGWPIIQGIWKPKPLPNETVAGAKLLHPTTVDGLVDFGQKGIYSAPRLTTENFTIAPTAIKFFNSDRLGQQYNNTIFVGDYNNGDLYHFNLDANRTELVLPDKLADKVANNPLELKDVVFGKGFGSVIDIQVGPDGCLYVLASSPDSQNSESEVGTIFKIITR
jgi:aldose sugar dehydrogenase